MNNKIISYFGLYDTANDNKLLACVRLSNEQDIYKDIVVKFFDTPEFADKFFHDPYGMIYRTDLKKYLEDVAPYVLENLLCQYVISDGYVKGYNPITDDNTEVRLSSEHEYKTFHDGSITQELLIDNGFVEVTDEIIEKVALDNGVPEYKIFSFDTRKYDGDKNYLSIQISNGLTNCNRQWYVHIDNSDMETIGSADIDTVEQFNLLMQIFDTKFRL